MISLQTLLGFPQASRAGAGTNAVTATIFGWGQYKDQIAALPMSEQAKIEQLADLIVSSFNQPGVVPYRNVVIIGHADKDWHGPAQESAVAYNRAMRVQEALTKRVRSLWEERNLGPPPPGGVTWETDEMGAKKMIAPPYHAQNRRVEVTLQRIGAPTPPTPESDTLEKRINRLLKLLETKKITDPDGKRNSRAKCLLNKMLKPNVVDVFVNGTLANTPINGKTVAGLNLLWGGNYEPPVMPATEFNKFWARVRPILMGAGFAPTQSDDKVIEILGELVGMIDSGISRLAEYLNVWTITSDITRTKLSSMVRTATLDDNNVYSCWR